MAGSFIVRPIGRARARDLCADHVHAQTLPNSTKYQMELFIDGRSAGLAAWGYGIMPRHTPRHLFDEKASTRDYLELCRFFVYDWCPKNTASRFLATTHRIIRRHAPNVAWLYTYAAGFQGMIGHIYKAAGYDYLGRTKVSSLLWIPGIGIVHAMALYHRYHRGVAGSADWQGLFPGARQWCGYNFRYIYWLCGRAERGSWLARAQFTVQPYPTTDDLEIWTIDAQGKRHDMTPDGARKVPIVRLPTRRRARSVASDTPGLPAGRGRCNSDPGASGKSETLDGCKTD